MRYRVIGTNQTNRKSIDTVIEAPSLERAGMLAKMKKIEVESIEPMDEAAVPTATLDYARPEKRKSGVLFIVVLMLLLIALVAGGFFVFLM